MENGKKYAQEEKEEEQSWKERWRHRPPHRDFCLSSSLKKRARTENTPRVHKRAIEGQSLQREKKNTQRDKREKDRKKETG